MASYPPPICAQALPDAAWPKPSHATARATSGFAGLALATSALSTPATKPTILQPTTSLADLCPGLSLPGSASQPLSRSATFSQPHTVISPAGASTPEQPSTLPPTRPLPAQGSTASAAAALEKRGRGRQSQPPPVPTFAGVSTPEQPSTLSPTGPPPAQALTVPAQTPKRSRARKERQLLKETLEKAAKLTDPATHPPTHPPRAAGEPRSKQRKSTAPQVLPSVLPPTEGERAPIVAPNKPVAPRSRKRTNTRVADEQGTSTRKRQRFIDKNPEFVGNMTTFKVNPPQGNGGYSSASANQGPGNNHGPPSARPQFIPPPAPVDRTDQGVYPPEAYYQPQHDAQYAPALGHAHQFEFYPDAQQQEYSAQAVPSVAQGMPPSGAPPVPAYNQGYLRSLPELLYKLPPPGMPLPPAPTTALAYRAGTLFLPGLLCGPTNFLIPPNPRGRYAAVLMSGFRLDQRRVEEGLFFYGNELYDPFTFERWVMRVTHVLSDSKPAEAQAPPPTFDEAPMATYDPTAQYSSSEGGVTSQAPFEGYQAASSIDDNYAVENPFLGNGPFADPEWFETMLNANDHNV